MITSKLLKDTKYAGKSMGTTSELAYFQTIFSDHTHLLFSLLAATQITSSTRTSIQKIHLVPVLTRNAFLLHPNNSHDRV